jgi:hypothetical protein
MRDIESRLIEDFRLKYIIYYIKLFVKHLFLEQRVRFELTVLGICSPLHWATLPPLH